MYFGIVHCRSMKHKHVFQYRKLPQYETQTRISVTYTAAVRNINTYFSTVHCRSMKHKHVFQYRTLPQYETQTRIAAFR
jgi:hypothetical protein